MESIGYRGSLKSGLMPDTRSPAWGNSGRWRRFQHSGGDCSSRAFL